MTTYALLVGIDAYEPPINPLYGCRNDIAALAAYLEGAQRRPPRAAHVARRARRLATPSSTRSASHLGQARAGDVALFAYAGHGSEEPAPPEIADLEPTGRIQTLMFHDCNRRVGGKLRRALADKELSLLLAEVAANGPHVVVILDCCHSGGGTRDPFARSRGWKPEVEHAEPACARPRPGGRHGAAPDGVPAAAPSTSWSAPRPPHVALAACRSYETAKEHRVGETTRGAFSVALVDALDTLGTRTTYRSLLEHGAGAGRADGAGAAARAVPARSRWSRRRAVPRRRRRAGRRHVHGQPRRSPGGRSTPGSSTACATRSATRRSCWPAPRRTGDRPGMVRVTAVEVGRSSRRADRVAASRRGVRGRRRRRAAPTGRGPTRPLDGAAAGRSVTASDGQRGGRRARGGARRRLLRRAGRSAVALRPARRAVERLVAAPCACASPSPSRASPRSGGPMAVRWPDR